MNQDQMIQELMGQLEAMKAEMAEMKRPQEASKADTKMKLAEDGHPISMSAHALKPTVHPTVLVECYVSETSDETMTVRIRADKYDPEQHRLIEGTVSKKSSKRGAPGAPKAEKAAKKSAPKKEEL